MQPKYERDGFTIHEPYHLLVSPKWPAAKMGLFQTKDYFRDKADLYLISAGVDMLAGWINDKETVLNRRLSVHLNCPGIGHGGQDLERILPYLQRLPDSVTVWRYNHERPQPLVMPPQGHWSWLVTDEGVGGLIENIRISANVSAAEAQKAFHTLFVGPPSENGNGLMMQYLTVMAYLELAGSDMDEDQRIGNAFQQARNTWSEITGGKNER